MKYKRQAEILKIINKKNISTHEQLQDELESIGFKTTQATISRDIKELGLVKIPSIRGASIYSAALPSENENEINLNIFSNTVTKISHAQHTVVLNTNPGMASAVAAYIDSIMKHEILGTIAGDDAILIITKNEKNASEIAAKLKEIFK